ncbi:MAG TPA: hypothetical protein VF532_10085 [Candidatus Angelobacter sp.]
MRLLFALAWTWLLFLHGTATASDQAGPQPAWSLNVQAKLGLRAFQTQFGAAWRNQQDVLFLTPERVLLYQVNQLREPARLAGRDSSGGAGNFSLEIRVLDVRNGQLLKTLELPTSAGFSKIIPTHDGKMIVRAGDSLFLCTDEFQPMASRALPIKGEAPIETWQIGVLPSGRQLALVHQQIKPSLLGPGQTEGAWALTEIQILDADTFELLKTFTVPHALGSWSAGEGVLVTANPAPAGGAPRFGFLSFEGNWTPLAIKDETCPYKVNSFSQGEIAVYGCGKLAVLGAHGEKLFSSEMGGDSVGSVGLAGRYMAVERVRQVRSTIPGTNFPVMVPKSDRLEVYDFTTSKKLFSLPVRGDNLYYEIAATGTLVVVDGLTAALYRLEN